MTSKSIPSVVLDTSFLKAYGLENHRLRRLLELSKNGEVEIYVPDIAWEEFRTQTTGPVNKLIRGLQDSIEKLSGRLDSPIIAGKLPGPVLVQAAVHPLPQRYARGALDIRRV